MKIREKEAETAISYYFSHEFSWKEAETAISYDFLMGFHDKEAETAISYDFSYENSWKRHKKLSQLKPGFGLNRFE